MTAKELIDSNIPTLNSRDNVERALQMMNDLRISQLPFVKDNHFEGIFSEDFLLNFDFATQLSELPSIKEEISIKPFTPLLEVIKCFENSQTEILPVINEQDLFEGIIEKKHAYQCFVKQLSLNEPGGIIEINLAKKDYSLHEISRIIENENAKITCLYLLKSNIEINNNVLLIIKLDVSQISNVVNSLSRYGFDVTAYYATEPVANLEKDRYEMLMKYLSI